tara:strand:+ start:847 stop:1152 length:306 start_codon:yes stop_codon:yes gene_type:complete
MKDISFLLELQKLAVKMDDLVEKYDMRERFVSVLVSGFLEEDDFGEMKMNAIYSYHIDSFFELEEIINFISTTYDYDPPYTIEDFEDDVDTMLKDLDIDTE